MKAVRTRIIVLHSGGVDSSACLAYYAAKRREVASLFVNYGQLARIHEQRAVSWYARLLAIRTKTVTVSGGRYGVGEILGRNALLASLALREASEGPVIIAMGIHSGTRYADCTPRFAELTQEMYDLYSGGRVRFEAPFLLWSKGEVLEYAMKLKIPIHRLRSCERSLPKPCGRCASCHDREALHAG